MAAVKRRKAAVPCVGCAVPGTVLPGKGRIVQRRSAHAAERARNEFQHHERLRRRPVLVPDPAERGRLEPEPWIVIGMTEHNDGVGSGLSTRRQPCSDERGPDPALLAVGAHSHWRESERRECGTRRVKRNGAESDVTNDLAGVHSDKCEVRRRPVAETVHKVRLVVSFKRSLVHTSDG